MSYVAIARKWRPTSFEEIAGQTHITRTLQNAIRLGRIHHAFLFTGARGVGKTTAARVLARALNCVNGPTPDPCGECPSCTEIASGASPDVVEIDGASNNSVDDVRELRESVRYLPQRGRRKVYIVDEVHMLSKGAFNALLKTLEEPPGHVVFIFATTEPQKIPETILSRVQRFDFKRIPATVVVERLQHICAAEGVRVQLDGLRLVARACEGSMRDAQSLLDRVISFTGTEATTEQVADVLGLVDRKLLYAMLQGMIEGKADHCLEAIERVYSYGYDLSEFVGEMLELLRNAALVGLSPSSRRYLDVPDDERERLSTLAEGVAPEVFSRSFQVMLDVHDQVARAARPRLVLEMAVAQLVTIRPARPIDQVLDRIGDIERRLRHGGVVARPREAGRQERGGTGGSEDGEPDPAPPISRAEPPPATPAPVGPILAPPAPGPAEAPPPPDPVPPPSGDPADEEGAEGLSGDLPAVPPGAGAAERFEALQVWLERQGARFDLWAKDGVLVEVRPPVLEVGFDSGFKTQNARSTAAEPILRRALSACFPGCERIELRERPSGALSRRQRAEEERKRRLAALREEASEDPVVRRACEILGATLVDVALPDGEPPMVGSAG